MNKENKKNKTFIIAAIGAVVVIAAAAAVIFSLNADKGSKQGGTTGNETTEITTISPLVDETQAETQEIQVGLSDIALSDSIKEELNQLNAACTKFYNERKDEAILVSEYGMLYSLSMENNVTVKTLKKNDYFKGSDEINDYTDLLLIKPTDYAEVSGKAAQGDELKIFTGFNTNEGYYVSSDGIEGAMLTEEEYNNLLFRYICSHGEIKAPDGNDLEYKKISEALALANIDIKYIGYDEKYAVAVSGSLSDQREVKQFLLEKDGNQWTKIMDGLESEKSPKQAVNMKYPDVDFGLFPAYNIADFDIPKIDMSDYIPSLKKLGMMDEDETCTYGCGTGHFVYMETSGGKKLLAVLDDNRKLQFYPMNSAVEARNAMLNLQKTAPTYIIKYGE